MTLRRAAVCAGVLALLLQPDRACARGRAARRSADSRGAAGCEHDGFDGALTSAVRLVRAQDHRGALPCLEAAHAERKDNLMAALYLGEALLRTGSLPRAASVLQHVLALDARSLMARLLLATVHQQAGQKLEAAEEFGRALDIDPTNVAALVNSGTSLRDLGRETEALARFESAVRVSPSTPEGHYNTADILLQKGKHRKALHYARAAAALRPSFSQAFVLMVLANEALRDFAAGVAASEEGLRHSPRDFSLRYQHARMLRAVAQFVAAEDAFRLCIAAGASLGRGGGEATSSGAGALQGASATYIAYAHNEYGHLLTQIGRGKEATEQFRQAVAVDPSFAQGWVNVGGDTSLHESISAYRSALRLHPSLIEAWINLGQVGPSL